MTMDMSEELIKHKVACVSLYPGYIDDKKRKNSPKPKKETSKFVSRAITALASDKNIMKKNRTGIGSCRTGKGVRFYRY